MNPAVCSGQQCRCEAGSPQIASRKYVQERHQRDQSEDPPRQLPAPAQVRPVGGQVQPHQHNGDGMQKTDQELKKLLHCPESTRARRSPPARPSTVILAAPARASRAKALALGKRIQHALPGPPPLKITRQPSRPLYAALRYVRDPRASEVVGPATKLANLASTPSCWVSPATGMITAGDRAERAADYRCGDLVMRLS